ncbi:MAG: DUF6638 family protein [Flavobacteriaceae bacterium]|nr:DUF6638 family protein [Flavobacteriaceae bacterium]
MQKLKDSKLYRNELIPISGKLVEHYNLGLEKLGVLPSKLKKFNIDGIGWSPEIAEEKGDYFYLNSGDANPHGLIITPLQKGKPIYNPFHSFDREMMKAVFNTHSDKINNATRDNAICIDFDQNIDAFYEPLDILKYDEINICFHLIDNLDNAQQEQLQLIEEFNTGHNFIDERIHEKLLVSAKKYGDLRFRKLELEPIPFKTDSFYTKAFGGLFVLRDFIKPILVFEDEEAHRKAIKDTTFDVLIYHISQPELVEKLIDHLIIECPLEKVVKTPRYDRIKKFIFSKELKDARHPIKQILQDKVLFKSYLNRIEISSLKKVNGVELYLERLERSNEYKLEDMVDQELYFALHQPHSSLTPAHQNLIWKLLTAISPLDVLHLFWFDKDSFYKEFRDWDESFQDWAIEVIRNNI